MMRVPGVSSSMYSCFMPNCSWDLFQIQHDPDQDKTVTLVEYYYYFCNSAD